MLIPTRRRGVKNYIMILCHLMKLLCKALRHPIVIWKTTATVRARFSIYRPLLSRWWLRLFVNLFASFLVLLRLWTLVSFQVPADTSNLSIWNDLFRKWFLVLKQSCGKFPNEASFLSPRIWINMMRSCNPSSSLFVKLILIVFLVRIQETTTLLVSNPSTDAELLFQESVEWGSTTSCRLHTCSSWGSFESPTGVNALNSWLLLSSRLRSLF